MLLYRLPLYILFGILPSLIWLFYYLKKDLHPEPKRIIMKVFLYGVFITLPVFILQIGLNEVVKLLENIPWIASFPVILAVFKWFVVIALTEELFKYIVVKLAVLKSGDLDEPLDIMLYMVVAALGFAALENVLYLFSPIDTISFSAILKTTVTISFIRFIGATFLHTLCSGLVGYFAALSSLKNHGSIRFTILGLILATLLHGLYNFSIITLSAPFNFLVPILVITGLAAFIFYDFDEIKKVKSICKI